MKRFWQGFATCLLLVAAVFGGLIWLGNKATQATASASDGSGVLAFLKDNPSRASVWARHNGKVVADLRSDRVMPLASTVKILIAIEYARQVASGAVKPSEIVKLAALDKYFLPDTDGGAHPAWLGEMKGKNKIAGAGVTIQDVALGMIKHSSNANTDWLIERLSLARINANIARLGLKNHTPLYSVVGAVYVAGEHGKATPQAHTESLRALPLEAYARRANAAHDKLRDDASGSFKKAFVFPDMAEQKAWSDRLPAASAREYGELMGRVNGRKYFSPKAQQVLEDILEWPLRESAGLRKGYARMGSKGGSTAWVLTQAFLGQTRGGQIVEGAILFDNLTDSERQSLEIGLNGFIAQLFRSPQFRAQLKALQ